MVAYIFKIFLNHLSSPLSQMKKLSESTNENWSKFVSGRLSEVNRRNKILPTSSYANAMSRQLQDHKIVHLYSKLKKWYNFNFESILDIEVIDDQQKSTQRPEARTYMP